MTLPWAMPMNRVSPMASALIKNKYIGRTFILTTQRQRENAVRIKLNAIAELVRGKRIVLVDDSIVRGTTSARIVRLLREAGVQRGAYAHFFAAVPLPLLLWHRHRLAGTVDRQQDDRRGDRPK